VTFFERAVFSRRVDSAPTSPLPSNAALGSRAQRCSSLALCLAGAALSLASIALSPDWQGALGAALGLLMLAVAWSDSHRFVVPDVLSGLAFALGVVNGVVTSPEGELAGGLSALSRAGLMAVMFFIVRVAYRQMRKREARAGRRETRRGGRRLGESDDAADRHRDGGGDGSGDASPAAEEATA
jgi:prepilin signal peptidase PulO-like enzyme (type II secretory pathway)